MIKTNSSFTFIIVVFAYLLFPDKAFSQSGDVYAAVKQGSKWGYIDTTGKVMIPFTMENCGSFSEGFANIKYGKYWAILIKKEYTN